MDATQITIKINQTIQPINGKVKQTSQSDSSVKSFDQIFAMINSIYQNSQTADGFEVTLSNGNTDTDVQSFIELDIENTSTEDLKKIEDILASILVAIQKSPQFNEYLKTISNNQSTSGISDLLEVEDSSLLQLLQNKVDLSSGNKIDSKKMMNQLLQLFEDISAQDGEILTDLLPNIRKDIQDYLTIQNKDNGNIPSDTEMVENKPAAAAMFRPDLILDKNQAILMAVKEPANTFQKNLNKSGISNQEMQVEVSGTSSPLFVQDQKIVNGNEVKLSDTTVQAPVITVDDFASEFQNLIGRTFRLSNDGLGTAEAKFSLYPEHLGPIEVKVMTQQGQVIAQIVTNTAVAKDALDGQLHHLREALQQQGILVQRLDITYQVPTTVESNSSNLSYYQSGSNLSNDQRQRSSSEDTSKESKKKNLVDLDRDVIQLASYGATLKNASSIDFNA